MMSYYIGIDGCRAGWFAVVISRTHSWAFSVYDDIIQLWKELKDSELLLIDIPIGLHEGGETGRRCDTMARKILGKRHVCVFTPPIRQALEFNNREKASEFNHSRTGRRINKQVWGIMPKIRQLDQLLRSKPDAQKKFREVHPEFLFWEFNGQKVMPNNKSKPLGYMQRLACLRKYFPDTDKLLDKALKAYPRKEVAKDDILDALVCAVTGFLSGGQLKSIPETPEFDPKGLPMEIVYHSFSSHR